jgi:hypothetical protein
VHQLIGRVGWVKVKFMWRVFPLLVQSTGHEEIRESGMAALMRCTGYVFYQVEERDAIGGKYNAPETYSTTLTENIKQLRAACSECNSTVYCGCCDNIPDWIAGDLKMWNEHIILLSVVFSVDAEQTISGWLVASRHREILRLRIEFTAGGFLWPVNCTLRIYCTKKM